MDEEEGRGFSQPEANPSFSLFREEEKRLVQGDNYLRLEKMVSTFLNFRRNNQELYLQTLEWEFLPKHTNQVLRRLQELGRLEVTDLQTGKLARKGSFYLSWDAYKQSSPRAAFALINI